MRVLIVEDHRDTARTLELLLRFCGHEVRVEHDGAAGVAAALAFHPEVVLCDIGLPGLDGYGVAGALKSDPDARAAYLIAVSGYGREEDRRRGAASGFDLHLTKPVDPTELIQMLADRATRTSSSLPNTA
jgi:CheY-like chemotaxis protein